MFRRDKRIAESKKKYLNYPEQQTAKHDLHRKLCIINKRILNMEKLHCIKDKNRA